MELVISREQIAALRNVAANIKLAVFDIDGTLIGADGRYSQRTKDAIRFLKQRNIATAIASGRPHYATTFLSEELELNDLGSFFAGALLFDPRHNKTIRTHFLTGPIATLLSSVQAANLYCEVYTESEYWLETPSKIYDAHRKVLRLNAKQESLKTVIDTHNVVKLLVGEDENTVEGDKSLLTQIEKSYPEFQFAYARMASHPHWRFASIISKLADRHHTFDELCRYYSITPNQVMAFGDAQSDHAFIERAGLGIAMGDAPEVVKASANYVTGTVFEEGVATAIELLFDT